MQKYAIHIKNYEICKKYEFKNHQYAMKFLKQVILPQCEKVLASKILLLITDKAHRSVSRIS